MGAELSTAIRGHKMSPECASFCECFEPYCHKDDISTHARATQFAILDGNHNGHASLAECMKWIQDTLNSKCPERGPDLFRYFYPSYIRAHHGAAVAGFDQTKSVKGTATAKEAEGEDNDRRLSIAEWSKNYTQMASAPFVALREAAASGDPDGTFAKIDADGKGMILFTEFCAFVKAGEARNNTDIGFILNFVAERDFVPTPGFGGGAKR